MLFARTLIDARTLRFVLAGMDVLLGVRECQTELFSKARNLQLRNLCIRSIEALRSFQHLAKSLLECRVLILPLQRLEENAIQATTRREGEDDTE